MRINFSSNEEVKLHQLKQTIDAVVVDTYFDVDVKYYMDLNEIELVLNCYDSVGDLSHTNNILGLTGEDIKFVSKVLKLNYDKQIKQLYFGMDEDDIIQILELS